MYWFVIPLILGFTSNVGSAFTSVYSEKWGKARGTLLTFILRNITGIPVWATGFMLAIRESTVLLSGISVKITYPCLFYIKIARNDCRWI